jgi:hypothetical protein
MRQPARYFNAHNRKRLVADENITRLKMAFGLEGANFIPENITAANLLVAKTPSAYLQARHSLI